jgi:hypothetical protein
VLFLDPIPPDEQPGIVIDFSEKAAQPQGD